MSETQDVIERALTIAAHNAEIPLGWAGVNKLASALASAGYRLAGPGECVVLTETMESVAAILDRVNYPSTAQAVRAMLSASQQKAPGSGESSEGSK